MRIGRTLFCLVAFLIATMRLGLAPHPLAADGSLKVMTFNIQHGIDGTERYNLQRAIDTIARIQPDLVGLQEVTRNHPYYNCDDQPARLAAGLNAATGRAWSVVYEQEWFTPNVECQQAGRGDGKETEGLAFLAPSPLGEPTMTPLPVSRIALAVKPASFRGVTAIVTHLASGRNNAAARQQEVAALMKWAAKLGGPQILLGDINAEPDAVEVGPLLAGYRDAWQVGVEKGVVKGRAATSKDRRIDYIFFHPERLELVAIETVETAGWFGKPASDHAPVVATFRVKEGS